MNDVVLDQRGIPRDVSGLPELTAAPPAKPDAPKVVQLPAAERATRQLLAESLQDYAGICIELDRLTERKRTTLEHIATLQTVLRMAEPKKPESGDLEKRIYEGLRRGTAQV